MRKEILVFAIVVCLVAITILAFNKHKDSIVPSAPKDLKISVN